MSNEVTELGKMLELKPRACGLVSCGITFKPRLDWQLYCCEGHARKARALRRKERIKVALSLLDGKGDGKGIEGKEKV